MQGDAHTLPLLAWQFVVIQQPDRGKVIDPVLAFARDHTVYYCQVAAMWEFSVLWDMVLLLFAASFVELDTEEVLFIDRLRVSIVYWQVACKDCLLTGCV